jgi:hypothetical protein
MDVSLVVQLQPLVELLSILETKVIDPVQMVVAIVELLVLKMIYLWKNDEREMEFLVNYYQMLLKRKKLNDKITLFFE